VASSACSTGISQNIQKMSAADKTTMPVSEKSLIRSSHGIDWAGSNTTPASASAYADRKKTLTREVSGPANPLASESLQTVSPTAESSNPPAKSDQFKPNRS